MSFWLFLRALIAFPRDTLAWHITKSTSFSSTPVSSTSSSDSSCMGATTSYNKEINVKYCYLSISSLNKYIKVSYRGAATSFCCWYNRWFFELLSRCYLSLLTEIFNLQINCLSFDITQLNKTTNNTNMSIKFLISDCQGTFQHVISVNLAKHLIIHHKKIK